MPSAICVRHRKPPGNAVGFLKNHSEEILRAENIRPSTPLAIMVVVNWAAPSTNTAGAMAVQDAILSVALNGNNCDTLGVVFTPVWERTQKGLLYKAESMVLDRIANANINCDERAVLSFEQRPHGKDKRPLEYPIRLCFPLNDRAEDSMWRRVPLVRDNRLAQRAVMLPTKNMIMV